MAGMAKIASAAAQTKLLTTLVKLMAGVLMFLVLCYVNRIDDESYPFLYTWSNLKRSKIEQVDDCGYAIQWQKCPPIKKAAQGCANTAKAMDGRELLSRAEEWAGRATAESVSSPATSL
jgi:hypothetical protein